MKIEYSATPDDIGALYSYLWRNSAYFRRRVGVGTLIVAVWILIAAYFSQGELALYDAFIALNVAIAFPILTPLLAMLRTKKEQRVLAIDPAGIRTQIGKKKGSIPWEKVAEVFVADHHVFILARNLNAFSIPNRAFQDDSQKIEFVRLCGIYAKPLGVRSKFKQFAWWALGFGVALLISFAPYLYESGWHLRHGNAVVYKGKRVPVPRRWVARANSQGVSLTMLPVTLFSVASLNRFTPRISISSAALPAGAKLPDAQETFEKSFWTYPPMAGSYAEIRGPVKFGAPPNEVYCMTASQSKSNTPAFAECLFQQGNWQATFLGTAPQIDKFYEILRGVK